MMEPAGIPRLGNEGHFMGAWIFLLEGTVHYMPQPLLCPLGNSPLFIYPVASPEVVDGRILHFGGASIFTAHCCSWKLGDPSVVLKVFLGHICGFLGNLISSFK